jgi:hypothetical protein
MSINPNDKDVSFDEQFPRIVVSRQAHFPTREGFYH